MTEEKKKERVLTLDEKFKILKANHDALVRATKALEKKYNKAVIRNQYLEGVVKTTQDQLTIQKKIVADSLTKHNKDMKKAAVEVQEAKFGKGKPITLPNGRR